MKILLVSHGDFAQGLCNTVQKFFGADQVYWACVTQENGTADLMEKTKNYMEQWGEEQVVICSDLKGGSANQAVLSWLERPNTYLISGMNLSLVLQLQMEQHVDESMIHDMLTEAKEDMVLVNEVIRGQMDDEDE